MTKIGIISACFGRQKVFEIFASGIQRLRSETGLDIPCVVAGDLSNKPSCDKYDIQHIEFPNKPLTNKFNRACEELRGSVDAVCVFGTDNVMETETFKRIYDEACKGVDLIGLSDVYFFGLDDIYTDKLIYFGTTKVLGVGRTVSSQVLDQMNWRPWQGERDRGIDTLMLDSVRPYVKTRVLLEGGYVFDLKTSLNLNRIEFWYNKLGAMPNNELFYDKIGEEEKRLVREFIDGQN